jgi:hypothetical protein
MWDGLRTTPETHRRAKVVPAALTCSAAIAWDSYFQCNTVTNTETSYTFANGFDNTCRLMSKGEGSHSLQVTISELLVVGHIATTYSRLFNRNLELSPCGCLKISSLLFDSQ